VRFEENVKKLISKKIGILIGNRSIENKLYIENAPNNERGILAIEKCFKELLLNYEMIDTTSWNFIDRIKESDVIFIYMHGELGEDGSIQGLLDFLGKPYTGSGVLPNAIGLNKVIFKHIITSIGIRTASFYEWDNIYSNEENVKRMSKKCFPPYMLKPVNGGSSIEISKHFDSTTLVDTLEKQVKYYNDYFIENFIEGKMITSGILEYGDSILALPLLEIDTKLEFYNEKIKLNKENKSELNYIIPANIPPILTDNIKETSITMFKKLGYKGFARFDYIVDNNENAYCLEVNSIPGLSENSNFVVACKHVGIEYKELLISLLLNALKKK
jgi:D-alanine-D-alanine ligase